MNKKEILNGEITLSYTLKSDDITKGEKPQGTPYLSREGKFDENGYNEETKSTLKTENEADGLKITLGTESDDFSEFGINLPLNFMGKKNGGGWRKQYLFNSPYSSPDNENIYCYLSRPDGRNLMFVFASGADGWKMDYSLFSGGHYFQNLKCLANFDKAYKTGSENKSLVLYLFEVGSFEEGLEKVSEIKGGPVATYDRSGGKFGEKIEIKVIGKCDEIEADGKVYPFSGKFSYTINKRGLTLITPYFQGRKGLACSVFGYESVDKLYADSMKSVSMDDIAKTDGNLCEHQCWVSAMLRFMMKYGKNDEYEKLVKAELDIVCETDENKAVKRQTILNKPYGGFPAFNVFLSGRVQEQFFGVTILLDAYKYFKDENYLLYAVNALDSLIENHQKEDGRIETYIEWSDSFEDYTTVCSPMIPICDMALFFEGKDEVKSRYYKESAAKIAEYLFKRGFMFPTEGRTTDMAETEMEDGSISCTALSLLYYCAKIERKEAYIQKAKEILDAHESWVIKTPLAPMFHSSLRWWETKWEGDGDGNALCCGHAWTIWRAEADYWYYFLTGNKEYQLKAHNGFMSNFAKIDGNGRSYSCYQPDYITGGGFTKRSEQVEFRIAKGFPRQTDSGLSRYVWIRFSETENLL